MINFPATEVEANRVGYCLDAIFVAAKAAAEIVADMRGAQGDTGVSRCFFFFVKGRESERKRAREREKSRERERERE